MKHLKKFNQSEKLSNDGLLNENNKWDPFKVITYIIELKILFEGFDYTTLRFKLLFPHYEEINDEKIKNRIEEKLSVFNNIVSYDLIKSEEAIWFR
jgi:hypothetical protein